MGILTVLIHSVQFKFIMLKTLHEDFIFYLHLPVLSETLLLIKYEKHKTGCLSLIILDQSSPTMELNSSNSLILEHLIIYGRSRTGRKGMLSTLLITAVFAMIQ